MRRGFFLKKINKPEFLKQNIGFYFPSFLQLSERNTRAVLNTVQKSQYNPNTLCLPPLLALQAAKILGISDIASPIERGTTINSAAAVWITCSTEEAARAIQSSLPSSA